MAANYKFTQNYFSCKILAVATILKTYRLKIYPSTSQQQKFDKSFGACRFVWNYFLSERKAAYLKSGDSMNYHQLCLRLTQLKNGDCQWLCETQATYLQQSLRDLDAAYKAFFAKRSGYPSFKKKYSGEQSFRKPNAWRLSGRRLQIERGLTVYCRGTLPPANAKTGSLTIKRDACGDYWATIICQEERNPSQVSTDPIGLDLGLTHLAITSEGEKFKNIRIAKATSKQLKALQQKLARQNKGSKARVSTKNKIAKLHRRTTNIRTNHLHKVTKMLADKNHAVIVCEDLAVKNMQKNHRLAGAIADASWGEFIRMLSYKQEWRGHQVAKIDRFFPSSKTCSHCSHIIGSLPLSLRQWTCPKCSTHHDRDINAAKMVLKHWQGACQGAEGTDGSRRKAVRVTGSMKRKVSIKRQPFSSHQIV
ncbi:endonuclease [Caudoviricetes sp.]|nr:endonuclease [Caudoviricetes sp.]